MEAVSFYSLGFGEPLPLSALHGLNINLLLDRITENLPPGKEKEETVIKVAVVGRPNVGKSSFVNRLLGEPRVIVDEEPGTTRDAVDTHFHHGEDRFVFVDTPGMKRKARMQGAVERYSAARARRNIRRADIVLLIIDAVEGLTVQDMRIGSYIDHEGGGAIILVNKWDLMEEELKNDYSLYLRENLKFLDFAPLSFVSALTGEGVLKVIGLIRMVAEGQSLQPASDLLEGAIREAVRYHPPPLSRRWGGKRLRIWSIRQTSIKPPTFTIAVNRKELALSSYIQYLKNRLRQNFGFTGAPLRMVLKEKGKNDCSGSDRILSPGIGTNRVSSGKS